jgi:hypothetical protein
MRSRGHDDEWAALWISAPSTVKFQGPLPSAWSSLVRSVFIGCPRVVHKRLSEWDIEYTLPQGAKIKRRMGLVVGEYN